MNERQRRLADNIGRASAAAFITYCAFSGGLPPSANEHARVDTCAAELGDGTTHVEVMPNPCMSYDVSVDTVSAPGTGGYDLMSAAQFREENAPGKYYDAGLYSVYMIGGLVTGLVGRKLAASFMADPDSATQRLEAKKTKAQRLAEIKDSLNTAPSSRPLPRRTPAVYDRNVRMPVHDDSPDWLLRDALEKLKAEQQGQNGQA